MRFTLALAVGRIVKFLGGLVKRSTNLPGEVAFKICGDFLSHFKFKGKIIAVTGSNGKTTTANLAAHILRENGYKVVNNSEGANLSFGIASTLMSNCNMKGFVDADFVFLEVDERYSPKVFDAFAPDVLLVTNLFRDQVVRNGNPDIIFDIINGGLKEKTTLVLNANDPISSNLGKNNKKVYYGMNESIVSSKTDDFITNDCKVCPRCHGKLNYNYYHYNHIGNFECPTCGYKSEEYKYYIDMNNKDINNYSVNGIEIKTNMTTVFNVFNSAAAVAACCECGVPIQKAVKAIETFSIAEDRYKEYMINGRKIVLLLTKQNSISLDQSISYVLGQQDKGSILLYINNSYYTEYKDVSWLYDVSFERLKNRIDRVYCTGNRAYDLAVRMEIGGFDREQLVIIEDIKNVKEATGKTNETIYILAGTAFGNDDSIIEAFK